MVYLIKIIAFLRKIYWFIFRPETYGVKALVFNEKNQVMLVKNTYDKRWLLPGGGIKRGESPEEAVKRELREETGIEITGLHIVGEYLSTREYKKDTIYLFYVEKYMSNKNPGSPEIEKITFFDKDTIPENASEPTKERIRNITNSSPFEKKKW
jgi:8-oxo-dGTP pyrophosphatase MutT (NUDIX family)